MAKRKRIVRAVPKKEKAPDFTDAHTWDGQHFSRAKDALYEYYRMNKKSSDYKKIICDYVKETDQFKGMYGNIAKCPDWRFSSTCAASIMGLKSGMPDVHQKYVEYWHSLPGTTGTPRPVSEYIEKWINELNDHGHKVVEEVKKKEEKEKKVFYRPSIQERIREQCVLMTEEIEQSIDDYYEGKITDFKHIKPLSVLRQRQAKQPHARLIKTWYDDNIAEYEEFLNPPDTSNMTEQEKDYAKQLQEAYSFADKKQIKKLLLFMHTIQNACDAIIAESKANRKPRRVSSKSPEKIVEKLKYKLTDEKYAISSIQPHKLVGATCMVIFNSKNRKLGIYYTSSEDPTGTMREGSGLTLKGQTLQRFDEKKSVCWTLRKPIEQLQEVKTLNTRRKFENWIEKITTTPIKMNGRINPETILIGVY